MRRPSLKICLLSESFLPKLGGVQVIVDNLAAELATRGHDVTVACPSYSGITGPEPQPGYRVERCFGSTITTFGLGVASWRRLLARERFDLVHAHNVWPAGTLALMAGRFKSKVVVTSHGRDILTDPEIRYGSRLNPVAARIIKETLKRVDMHTVVSSSMESAAREAGSSPSNIVSIPNFLPHGPRVEDLTPALHEAGDDLARPGSSQKYLLMIGRLHAVKGFDLALKLFSEARSPWPELKLKIAGTGAAGSDLRRLAADLGVDASVEWLGQVTGADKERLIRGAWAVLVTSRVEAFCLAALEAMAIGTPVIAPDRAPFNDIIGGQNGLLIDPDQPETLMKSLLRLADPDVAEEISFRARETAAGFSRRSSVDRYEEIYYELIGEEREPTYREKDKTRRDIGE